MLWLQLLKLLKWTTEGVGPKAATEETRLQFQKPVKKDKKETCMWAYTIERKFLLR